MVFGRKMPIIWAIITGGSHAILMGLILKQLFLGSYYPHFIYEETEIPES